MDLQGIKQRFGIIGNNEALDRALDIAVQVAPTDISVLVIGESGVGKEHIPNIIHQLSARKHGKYIAVNCGAIPEGTIDSELFGHEKGSFTGANEMRKGYFEEADHGTIFLDEVAELPLSTQVRLLRVLESKEFIKVGSSKAQKTDVRVVAATNVNMAKAVREGRFREDLYYRLNTVQINMPPLRDRGNDIILLFRKFAQQYAEKYEMPSKIVLRDNAQHVLLNYRWPGNIRQLRNVVEQMSIIEQDNREITAEVMAKYLTDYNEDPHPVLIPAQNGMGAQGNADFSTERELLYKVLFDMRNDIAELKKQIRDLVGGNAKTVHHAMDEQAVIMQDDGFDEYQPAINHPQIMTHVPPKQDISHNVMSHNVIDTEEVVDDNLSLAELELINIKKALEKYKGKRKAAAQELGISERTLYRKLKEYNLAK